MSEGIDPEILAWTAYLAGLDEKERAAAVRAGRQALIAQLPDDEVGKPPIRTLGEYLDEPIDLPPMLVEPGFVARGAISLLISRGGKGKTAVSLNRLMRWSMGKPLFDAVPEVMLPTRPLKILMIENEGAPGHFQQVLDTILNKNDFTDDEKALARKNLLVWGNGGWSGLKLDDPEQFAMVRRGCEQTNPDILFLEPFRGLWKGAENDDVAMANVLDQISLLANDFELGALITHHERKSSLDGGDPMSAARGSTVFEGHAAVMERWMPTKGHDQRELSTIKNRFNPEPPPPVRMEFDKERWGYRYVGEAEKLETIVHVLRQLAREDYLTISDVAEECGENYATTRRYLNQAAEKGYAGKRALGQGNGYGYRYKPQPDEADDEGSGSLTVT